ncbi:MAG: hypothetical protein ACE37K_02680 [Planctomycetota bacterium]
MIKLLSTAATVAAVLCVSQVAVAQQCYSPQNRCFSFAPPGDEVERVDTGLTLRSDKLRFTGDTRLRGRFAETPDDAPYNANDNYSTRTRLQLDYEVNEWAQAYVEFNYSEVWAGAEGYSDAAPFQQGPNGILSRENFNGIAQAYMQLEDAFGFDERIRIGRSNYFLANGMVLGSCDFLQYPGAFTGIWVSRSFGDIDVEAFAFDNYGPLQSQLVGGGERYAGGTARWNACEDGLLETLNAYFMTGTNDGDVQRNANDNWAGLEGVGHFTENLKWEAQFAHRSVDMGDDVTAYRARLEYTFDEPCCGFLRAVAFTRTDSEGALHINPADFNSAGLLHQYGGIWRSDLDTNQLSAQFTPGFDLDCTATVLTLDRDGAATQLGELEFDLLVGKMVRPGLHVGAGYAIDDDQRQVGYAQATLYF